MVCVKRGRCVWWQVGVCVWWCGRWQVWWCGGVGVGCVHAFSGVCVQKEGRCEVAVKVQCEACVAERSAVPQNVCGSGMTVVGKFPMYTRPLFPIFCPPPCRLLPPVL